MMKADLGGRVGVNGLVAGLLTSFPAITNCGVCVLFIIARFQRTGGRGMGGGWRVLSRVYKRAL